MCDTTDVATGAYQRETSNGDSSASTNSSLCVEDGVKTCNVKRRHPSQPVNTTVYTVKGGDKITTIAALYDTTPACLRSLNKLMVDFVYPGQQLYVPSKCQDELQVAGNVSEKDTFLASMVSSTNSDDLPKGNAPSSGDDHSSSSTGKATPISSIPSSSDLESDFTQKFIKVHSKHITNDQGVVDGTLIVTPNAVMFDPNVSDPLVIENGVEEYGVVVKMDSIVSAAIYRDIEAMRKITNKETSQNTPDISKPQVYHAPSCDLITSKRDLVCDDSTKWHDDIDVGTEPSECDDDLPPHSMPISCSCGAGNMLDSLVEADENTKAESSNLFSMDYDSPTETTSKSNDVTVCDSRLSNNDSFKSNTDEDRIESSSPIRCDSYTQHAHMAQFSFDDLDDQTPCKDLNTTSQVSGSSEDYSNMSFSLEQKVANVQSKLGHRRSTSSSSSIYNVPITDSTEIYVNFSSGLFAQNSLPKLQTQAVINNWKNSIQKSREHNSNTRQDDDSITKKSSFNEIKETLFKCIDDLIPNTLCHHKHFEDEAGEPFYFCVQVAQPINKPLRDSSPFELYAKRKHKPFYWFSVPCQKVDLLYSFFVRLHPEIYGENVSDEQVLSSKGFIPIQKDDLTDRVKKLNCGSPMTNSLANCHVYKDWEIVTIDEIIKRRSMLDIDKYLPLPELSEESNILTEDHIRQIVGCLPIRLEGHSWNLMFSHVQNGFSLAALYRRMSFLDSPVLLVIEDINSKVFGAFSPQPFHLSEHFYGTGECFLFTFDDGFKVFHWTGKNSYFSQGEVDGLTIGTGGSTCGLWIDGDLYHGRTQCCDTFNNDPLTCDGEDFIIKAIEIWSFDNIDDDQDMIYNTKGGMFHFSTP